MKKTLRLMIICFSTFMVLQQGCYYDKEAILYPGNSCDTSAVSYSKDIAPVLSNRCYTCHSTAPSGNIGLDDHAEVVVVADNGRLMGSIRHQAPYQAMPQGGGKLTECEIAKFQAWINQGKKNN